MCVADSYAASSNSGRGDEFAPQSLDVLVQQGLQFADKKNGLRLVAGGNDVLGKSPDSIFQGHIQGRRGAEQCDHQRRMPFQLEYCEYLISCNSGWSLAVACPTAPNGGYENQQHAIRTVPGSCFRGEGTRIGVEFRPLGYRNGNPGLIEARTPTG